MFYTTDIEEAAVKSAKSIEVCFVLTKQNKYSLFTFCYYQLKHKTLKEFNCIIYAERKDILYYILKSVAFFNHKKYTLTYDINFKI